MKDNVLSISNSRIDWIDMLKGLAILLIVIGHFSPGGKIERYIYSAHVFCFFAVSGFLFKPNTRFSLEFLQKKAKRLLIPYAFWSLSATLYTGLAENDWQKAITSMLTLDGYVGWNAPIWFLPVIFLAEVFFCFVNEKHRLAKFGVLVVSPFVWYACKGYQLPFELDVLPLALLFFALGHMLCGVLYEEKCNRYITKASVVLIPVFFFLQLYFGVFHNRRIAFTKAIYGNYLFCLIAGVAGVLFFFLLFRMLPTWRPLAKLGKNSLFIMCSHYWVILLADTVSEAAFQYDLWKEKNPVKAVMAGVFVTVIVHLIAVGITALCQKHPRLTRVARSVGISV